MPLRHESGIGFPIISLNAALLFVICAGTFGGWDALPADAGGGFDG